jgi:GTP cyclohydrolase I
MDLDKIEQGIRLVLEGLGEDTHRDGLQRTPRRVAEMYQDVLSGTHQNLADIVEPIPSDLHQELVLIKDIPFHSICERWRSVSSTRSTMVPPRWRAKR